MEKPNLTYAHSRHAGAMKWTTPDGTVYKILLHDGAARPVIGHVGRHGGDQSAWFATPDTGRDADPFSLAGPFGTLREAAIWLTGVNYGRLLG